MNFLKGAWAWISGQNAAQSGHVSVPVLIFIPRNDKKTNFDGDGCLQRFLRGIKGVDFDTSTISAVAEDKEDDPWIVPLSKYSCMAKFKVNKDKSEPLKCSKLYNFTRLPYSWSTNPNTYSIDGWIECPDDVINAQFTNIMAGRLQQTARYLNASFGTWKTTSTFVTRAIEHLLEAVRLELQRSRHRETIKLYFLQNHHIFCMEWIGHTLVQDVAATAKDLFLTLNKNPCIYLLKPAVAETRYDARTHSRHTSLDEADRTARDQNWVRVSGEDLRNIIGDCDVLHLSACDMESHSALVEYFISNVRPTNDDSTKIGKGLSKTYRCRFRHSVEMEYFQIREIAWRDHNLEEAYLCEVLRSHGLRIWSKLNERIIDWLLTPNDTKGGDINSEYLIKCAFVRKIIELTQTHSTEWHRVSFDFDVRSVSKAWVSRSNGWRKRCLLVKKAIISPSSVRYLLPQLTAINRILSENEAYSCCFMTATFRDEDLSSKMENPPDELIQPTIGDRLYDGLRVAGRTFRYLGGSNSQLKEHSCYLHAKDATGRDSFSLRKNIGDLSHIRNRATFVKRLGMAFSSSKGEKGFSLPENCAIVKEDDIQGEDLLLNRTHCFSDGIGRISFSIARKVIRYLTGSGHRLPSAFQVRLGGAKGLLAIDPSLKGEKIVLRRSMVKFESTDRTLYVQDTSSAKPLHLNHQIVTLLSQHGIPDTVFHKLQEDQYDRILMMFLDEALALKELGSAIPLLSWKCIKRTVDNILEVPLFRRLLVEIGKKKIYNIITKARIFVSNGHSLMGVLDETATLEYGEVYITGPRTNFKPYIGNVVVSKMPALHPGDARKLKAVDNPRLKHMQNVIVFPQKGPRPHPDEMAGSDLDGDLFWVTWHPGIVENFRIEEENFPAMDYTAKPTETQDRPIEEKDMIDFIMHFIQTDVTSKVARAHLCMADQETDGIFSTNCIQLAELHSRAVDAPKTGERVELPEKLIPKKYPDFLNKSDHKVTMQSKRILGKLYRQFVHIYEALQDLPNNSNAIHAFVIEGENHRPNEHTNNIALQMRRQFLKELGFLQTKFQMEEVELLTGNVFGSKSKQYSQDFRVFQQQVQEELKSLLIKFDKLLQHKNQDGENMCNLALSSFQLEPSRTGNKSLCFPWLFSKWLPANSHPEKQKKDILHHFQTTGFEMMDLLNSLKKNKIDFEPLLKNCSDSVRAIFQANKVLCLNFLYFGIAVEFSIELEPQTYADFANLVINLAVQHDILQEEDTLRVTHSRNISGCLGSVYNFFRPNQSLLQLNTSIKKALGNTKEDTELVAIGRFACTILLFSSKLSGSSNPLFHIDGVHRANAHVDALVMHNPIKLTQAVRDRPNRENIHIKELTLTMAAARSLRCSDSALGKLKELGLEYHLEGRKLSLNGNKIILKRAEEIIEELNKVNADRPRSGHCGPREPRNKSCHYCKELGHVKRECPKLILKNFLKS